MNSEEALAHFKTWKKSQESNSGWSSRNLFYFSALLGPKLCCTCVCLGFSAKQQKFYHHQDVTLKAYYLKFLTGETGKSFQENSALLGCAAKNGCNFERSKGMPEWLKAGRVSWIGANFDKISNLHVMTVNWSMLFGGRNGSSAEMNEIEGVDYSLRKFVE